MELTDSELVSRSQRGDLGAFNVIVERYQSQVFNLVARMLGNRTWAEDVTQEAFISAYRAIGKFRGGVVEGMAAAHCVEREPRRASLLSETPGGVP